MAAYTFSFKNWLHPVLKVNRILCGFLLLDGRQRLPGQGMQQNGEKKNGEFSH
jgi:hypothetical protein